jgi:diguanylate cyclase (GGDEF)-like protein/PAS domain S-box-containing protein
MMSPRGRGTGAHVALAESTDDVSGVELLHDAGNFPAVIFQLHRTDDGHARFVALNDRVRDYCELAPAEAYAASECFASRLHPDDLDDFLDSLQRAQEGMHVWHSEHRVILPMTGTRWHEVRAEPQRLDDGSVLWHGLILDITERKLREERLSLEAVAFDSQQGFVITDARGIIVRVNHCFTEITGYSNRDAVDKAALMFLAEPYGESESRRIAEHIRAHGHWHGEIVLRRADGKDIPCQLTITAVRDRGGRATNFVGAFHDISERKAAEQRIHELAYYDPLTRLANRRLLMDRLAKAMANSRRSRQYGAILYLDLDNFKVLNDTFGHDHGDQLLCAVAERLNGLVRDGDSVARLGGDEFVVLLGNLGQDPKLAAGHAEGIANKIRHALGKPYLLPGLSAGTYHSTTSLGVCLFLDHEEPVESLLKYADIALYQAKTAGRNAVCVYQAGYGAVPTGRGADTQSRADAWIAQAINLLDQRMATPPTVMELAHQIGTNVRKLTGLFRKKFGLTVTEYFTELRLETARRLLVNCDQQIQLIGERIGYRNAGDFTRAFRRRYGMSPRAYRRLHCQGNGAIDD